jgi:hypothetical protein
MSACLRTTHSRPARQLLGPKNDTETNKPVDRAHQRSCVATFPGALRTYTAAKQGRRQCSARRDHRPSLSAVLAGQRRRHPRHPGGGGSSTARRSWQMPWEDVRHQLLLPPRNNRTYLHGACGRPHATGCGRASIWLSCRAVVLPILSGRMHRARRRDVDTENDRRTSQQQRQQHPTSNIQPAISGKRRNMARTRSRRHSYSVSLSCS